MHSSSKPVSVSRMYTLYCLHRVYSRKKGHACDFAEKGQKKAKKGKIFGNSGRKVKYFEERQAYECDYPMHETARICPVLQLDGIMQGIYQLYSHILLDSSINSISFS